MSIPRRAVLVIRWWFGTTWALAAVGGVVAAPIMIALGNWGGLYMFGGAVEIGAAAWFVHPWGFARLRRERPEGVASTG